MSDIIDQWRKDTDEVRELVRLRFPNFSCPRCGKDNFLMRVWRDSELQPAFEDDRVVEYICDNCGLIERHLVDRLADRKHA
jgi:predicted RNA-binding Zn-ribbon protein involved in translation (DUF1610 family)